jgi:electron transfer flavoprotein alpha/beta subunit
MVDRGTSERAIAKCLRLPIRRIQQLVFISDVLVAEETGQLPPRLAAFVGAIEAAIATASDGGR